MNSLFTSLLAVALMTFSGIIYSCETLSMNGADGWYPYFSRQNTYQNGIVGDVVNEAAHRAGLIVELQPSTPWKRVIYNLVNGDLDIIAGALKNQQREKQLNFSSMIHYAELRVFVRKDQSLKYKLLSDLKNKKGAKLRGMSLGQSVDEYAFNNLILTDISTSTSLFKMIATGRLDYGIFYWISGLKEIDNNNLAEQLEALPILVSKEGLYIAYSKKSRCQKQIDLLDSEVEKMKTDGAINAIISNYQPRIGSQKKGEANEL